jgi:hypothetical protein
VDALFRLEVTRESSALKRRISELSVTRQRSCRRAADSASRASPAWPLLGADDASALPLSPGYALDNLRRGLQLVAPISTPQVGPHLL